MSPADKLGVLPGFGWVFNLNPLLGGAVIVGMTHVIYLLLALIEDKSVGKVMLRLQHGFNAWRYGDLMLAAAFAVGLVGARTLSAASGRWYQSFWLHIGLLLFWLIFGIYRWAIQDFAAYTPEQSASLTKFWHDTLFPLIGYMVTVVLLSLLDPRNWNVTTIVVTVAIVVFVGVWLWLGIGDGNHPEKAEFAHPKDFVWPVSRFVRSHVDPWLRPISARLRS